MYVWLLQLPLDLSPLATPVVRNKIEEHTPVVSHRDSPLPHPESTTTDDKVRHRALPCRELHKYLQEWLGLILDDSYLVFVIW